MLFYDHEWWRTGGYAHLHRNVPLYDRKSGAIAVDSPSAFDAIVLKRSSIPHFIAEFRVCDASVRTGHRGRGRRRLHLLTTFASWSETVVARLFQS